MGGLLQVLLTLATTSFSYTLKLGYLYLYKNIIVRMKNASSWYPTKFEIVNEHLQISSNPLEVSFSSQLIGKRIAEFYDIALRKYAHGNLLDLGCGAAPLYGFYRKFVDNNICVDWNNSPHSSRYIDFACDLNQALPFQENSFDTIILSDVLEHIRKPYSLLKEISRILTPKGKILINVPFYYWLHEEPHDYFRYTRYALETMTEEANLKIIELYPMGGSPEILADLLAKNIHSIRAVGKPLAIFVQKLAWFFIKTEWGNKISESSSHKFPLGYFLIAEK